MDATTRWAWCAAALALSCGGAAGPGTPAPAPSTALAGEARTWGAWALVVPGGLTVVDFGDHLTLDKPGCRLTVWPPVPAGTDLDAQALALFNAGFGPPTSGGVVGKYAASPLNESTFHRRGVTGQGFPFVELNGELLDGSGRRSGQHVRIAAYQLGAVVAAVLGWEAAYADVHSPQCLSEVLDPYAWTLLAYSTRFPGHQAASPRALRDALVGGWFGAETGTSISLAWSDVFFANGHHSDLMGVETYRQTSATEVTDTFSAWQGTSLWGLEDNRLTIWPLDPARPAHTEYVRLSREYNPAEASGWRAYLYRLGTCATGPCERWSVKDP